MILPDGIFHILRLEHVDEEPLRLEVDFDASTLVLGMLRQGGSCGVDRPHLSVKRVQKERAHVGVKVKPRAKLIEAEGVGVVRIVLLLLRDVLHRPDHVLGDLISVARHKRFELVDAQVLVCGTIEVSKWSALTSIFRLKQLCRALGTHRF